MKFVVVCGRCKWFLLESARPFCKFIRRLSGFFACPWGCPGILVEL